MPGSSAARPSNPALSKVKVVESHFCTPAVAAVIDLLSCQPLGSISKRNLQLRQKRQRWSTGKFRDWPRPWQTARKSLGSWRTIQKREGRQHFCR